ncbi:MAG: methylthioribose-1-phosphate isomerase [Rhodothermales bacterium]
MNVGDTLFHAAWIDPEDEDVLKVIDQRHLPHRFQIEDLRTLSQVVEAIADMHVRGAPLIGAVAAFGMLVATQAEDIDASAADAARRLKAARPTAINLAWAVDKVLAAIAEVSTQTDKRRAARLAVDRIFAEELSRCRRIGEHGVPLLRELASRKDGPLRVLTHCNAGWLACIDFGTATSPIYLAHDSGLDLHVWVDETRPRNQGMLTAWELGQHGVPHTVVTDNAGGHLMQQGLVDVVLVGTDRTTRNGDVANKIGTYLKALAAHDNGIPFYVALPSSSIDWSARDGSAVPIEERSAEEVRRVRGAYGDSVAEVVVVPPDSPVMNPAFDITPARLVTGLITERGVCAADEASLAALFPEMGSDSG